MKIANVIAARKRFLQNVTYRTNVRRADNLPTRADLHRARVLVGAAESCRVNARIPRDFTGNFVPRTRARDVA
jgi:hypothetical protein